MRPIVKGAPKSVGPQDSHKNVIKLVGGGGKVEQICQEVVSEILEKQAKNAFSRIGSKVLVSKRCLNTAARGILSQSYAYLQTFSWGSCPQTQSFQYLLLSQLQHVAGYRDSCLLPLLK